jgi:hypothetical protein
MMAGASAAAPAMIDRRVNFLAMQNSRPSG